MDYKKKIFVKSEKKALQQERLNKSLQQDKRNNYLSTAAV